MIPKTLHYVWLGGKDKPRCVQKCLSSWRKQAPDFAVKEWNETNFPLREYPFAEAACKAGNFAFASDVVRAAVLLDEGGIYLDTDVELLQNPAGFLDCRAFAGFEAGNFVGTAVLGTQAGFPLLKAYLSFYNGIDFQSHRDTNVVIITQLLTEIGLCRDDSRQTVQGMEIWPQEYFSPFDYRTGRTMLTDNTVAIHHYEGTWLPRHRRVLHQAKMLLGKAVKLP
ncbi:MAG: glycosyl transferase [Oscillospiraceae bacterium]|jgi:mannosyltransferase OCH1-like enzyme|nr:glycosyl transferase [Oscillospiraceae bacterium]